MSWTLNVGINELFMPRALFIVIVSTINIWILKLYSENKFESAIFRQPFDASSIWDFSKYFISTATSLSGLINSNRESRRVLNKKKRKKGNIFTKYDMGLCELFSTMKNWFEEKTTKLGCWRLIRAWKGNLQ